MPMPSFETLVIGGGTNGMACAARLAQAGHRVTLLEAEASLGGGARGWDFAPGYRAPGLAHVLHLLDPRVSAGMDLPRHGLQLAAQVLPSVALGADGRHLTLRGACAETIEGDLPDADRRAWADLRARLLRFAAVLAPMKAMTPPRLAKGAGNDLVALTKLGLKARLLGSAEFRELLRMFLINVWDVLEDELSDPRLKGAMAFDATLGAWTGPRSPNSLLGLLNRLAGEAGGQQAALSLPAGGMEAVAKAMAAACSAAGVVPRSGSPVAALIVADDRVVGARLASGEEVRADHVVSALSPKTTLLQLLGPRHLDAGMATRMAQQKSRGGAARLHLALRGLPDFRGADPRARLVIAPSADAVETAFNPVKYGEVPDRPVMEIVIPSLFTPGLAPEGHHVLSAILQFAPHDPKAGLEAARAQLLENALAVLESHAPGLRALVAHAELLMPQDIAARFGMVGGNWHHGELSVEQMLFLRPLPFLAQYRGPLPGLWLASGGSHPGGGISGAAGWNAAAEILKGGRA